MGDKYSILGQENLATTGNTAIYTVPTIASSSVTAGGTSIVFSPKAVSDQTQTLLTTLYICTTAATDGTIEITVVKSPSSTITKLFTGRALTANQTDILTLNLTLSPGDILKAEASGTLLNVDVTAFGVEMITGVGPSA